MARSLSVLQAELKSKVWAPTIPVTTTAGISQAWASAYGVYATDARGCGTPPAGGQIALAEIRLANILVTAFAGFSASVTANGMQTAFMAFWTTFAFVNTTVATPGAPTLGTALTSQWNAFPKISDIDVAVNAHASIIHTWTNSVITGPPCSAPIT
jgi:hypothetical protein